MRTDWWAIRHDALRLREVYDSFDGERDASVLALEAFLAISDGKPAEALPLAEEAILGIDSRRRSASAARFCLPSESPWTNPATSTTHGAGSEKPRTAFENQGDRRSAVDALSEIALTWHRQSEFAQALALQEECLQASRNFGYRQGEAHAWNRIANVQDRLGDYVAALDAHQRSLRLRQTLGDGRGEAASLGNIGNIHIQLGAYDDAIRWYEASITRCREVGFTKQEFAVLGNLGLAYQGKRDWENARRCHEESLVQKEAIGRCSRRGEHPWETWRTSWSSWGRRWPPRKPVSRALTSQPADGGAAQRDAQLADSCSNRQPRRRTFRGYSGGCSCSGDRFSRASVPGA